MDNIKIGKYISFLRKEKKLTQQQLADKLMITNKAVSKWETGEGLPDINILPALAEVLNISVDTLLSGGEENGSHQHEGNEAARYIIEKRQLHFKQACLISFAVGILGIILMAGILLNTWNGQRLFGVAIGLGLFCQIISIVIFEMSNMSINLEIKSYNSRFTEQIVPYTSRTKFYLKAIWVWLFVPVWYFIYIIFEYFYKIELLQMIVRLLRFFHKEFIIPVFFIIVYFIICTLISICIFLLGKYKKSAKR